MLNKIITIITAKTWITAGLIIFVCMILIFLTIFSNLDKEKSQVTTGPSASTKSDPNTLSKTNGQIYTLDLLMNTNGTTIAGVDMTLIFNPVSLHFVDFKPTSSLDTTFFNYSNKSPGVLKITAVDTTKKTINNKTDLGAVIFQGDANGLQSVRMQSIQLSSQNSIINSGSVQLFLISKSPDINIDLSKQTVVFSATASTDTSDQKLTNLNNCLSNKKECTPQMKADSDLNKDGKVDDDDLNILQRQSIGH